jgi:hypothetical protein
MGGLRDEIHEPTDVREGLGVYGFTAAATMVHVLDQMESELGGTLL